MECPICKLKYSPRDIQGHVNQCLDRKETKKQVKEDEKLAQQLHRQLSVSSTTPDQNNYPQQQRSSPSQVNPQAYASPNTSPQMFYPPVHPQQQMYAQPNYFYPPAPMPYPYQPYPVQYNGNRPITPPNHGYPQPYPQSPYHSPVQNGSPVPGYTSAYAVPHPYSPVSNMSPYPGNSPIYNNQSPLPPHYQQQNTSSPTTATTNVVPLETIRPDTPTRIAKPIIQEVKPFNSPSKSAFTQENQEERLKSMDQTWLSQLKQDPNNEAIIKALITGHLNVILTTENHRFGKLLPRFVASWNKKYKKNPLMLKRRSLTDSQFQNAIEDVKGFINNLISVLDNFYGGLCSLNDNIRAYCESAIGDLLFPTIYKDLFEIFKQKCKDEDAQFAKKRKDLLTINLAHLGVPKMYWLLSEESFDSPLPADPPYHKAIVTLQQITTAETPAKKIDILIQTANAIVSCIHDHWRPQMDPSKILIGGDELLPLFAYVVIRSGITFLWSESSFIETFINEKTAIEKGGYLLATLQTCLNLVNTIDIAQLQTNAKEMIDKAQKEAESKALVKWENPTNVSTLENLEKLLEDEQEELWTFSSSPGSVLYENQKDMPHIDVDLIEL